MQFLVCGICEKQCSGPLASSDKIWGYIVCESCLVDGSKEAAVMARTQKYMDEIVWHLGAFEDINLDSGIGIAQRFILANEERFFERIISNEDLERPIVDIGCNCGHFLRKHWLRGARNITGIEPRQEHIDFGRKWAAIEGAEVNWINKAIEDVKPDDIPDGAIVFCLGLVYHLHEPNVLFDLLHDCKMHYGIIESQLYAIETMKEETVVIPQNTFTSGKVWQPTMDGIRRKLEERGLTFEELTKYKPACPQPRAMWKVTNGEVKDATDSRLATDES